MNTVDQHERQAAASIRILLVDDHTVMRAGTRRILEDEPDIAVVGEAEDGVQALTLAAELVADVVVLDIGMPNLDGVQTCTALRRRWPELHILILTGHDNGTLVRTLYQLGVEGYLLKSAGPQELVSAIRAVSRGVRVYGESATRALAQPEAPETVRPTRKELEVLATLAQGMKNRDMAEALHMSENTVEYHLRNLFAKLGASSRAEALLRAQRLGWLDSQEPLC
jgi:DNA-binding NarL/FixJ family response regulator